MKTKLENLKKTILVFDIETSSSYPDGKPINIRENFDDYVLYAKCKWFGCYSYKYNKYICDEVKGNEDKIRDFIEEHEVLVGFNNEEFDTPIIQNNGLMPEADASIFEGSTKRFTQVDNLIVLGSSAYQRHNGLPFKNRGVLMGYKFKRNSLKEIAKSMDLPVEKGDIDYMMFFQETYTDEQRAETLKYLRNDVEITKLMFDKLWDFWMPFTDFITDKNIMNLSWIKSSIASLTYKAACCTLDVEETYADIPETDKIKGTEEMGGRVIDPKYEESRGIWYVDYKSLYPHIDAMFNLFAEINSEDGKKLLESYNTKVWHGNDLFQVKGYYDISKQHRLSVDVAEKLKTRITLKETDPDNPMVYTLKIFLNALYGCQRSPVFEQIHTPNAGWDICWLGQQINELTEKMMDEFGFETIAGDTDSLFIKAKEEKFNNKEYVLKCLQSVVNKIKENVPFPTDTFDIDIENYLDYVKWPFSLQPIKGPDGKNLKNEKGRLIKELRGKKKNYLYLYTKKNVSYLKIVGLPIIKDNATPLGQKILEEQIKPAILNAGHASFTKVAIQTILNEYLEDTENLKLLAREFKVKKAASYKKDSQIQAQISEGYFNGQDGVVSLIKLKITGDPEKKGYRKIGCAGKTNQYCTVEELVAAGISVKDLDLTKVQNELEPFIEITKIKKEEIEKNIQSNINNIGKDIQEKELNNFFESDLFDSHAVGNDISNEEYLENEIFFETMD